MVDVVTVACKLRSGLILRTFRKEQIQLPVIGGGMRDTVQYLPTGEQYIVNGNTAPWATPLLDSEGNAIMMEQSFALTPNIPKAFWELWLSQNATSAVVKNGLIFASAKPLELRAEAKAKRDQKHGLEPIDVHSESGDLRKGPNRRTKLREGLGFSKMETADVASTG